MTTIDQQANIISAVLLIIPTLCYAGVAVNEARRGNGPVVMTFGAYSIANLGLLWGLWK